MVQEFIDGQNFYDFAMDVDEGKICVTKDQALDFFVQLIMTIFYMHDQGVMHGDLRAPQHIMVKRDVEGALTPVLIDFGQAESLKNPFFSDSGKFIPNGKEMDVSDAVNVMYGFLSRNKLGIGGDDVKLQTFFKRFVRVENG